MKWKSKIIILGIFLVSCGQEKVETTSLTIDLSLDQNLAALSSDIEIYRFKFSGNFLPIIKDISRKQYRQFSFSDIPNDDHLLIQVEALNLSKDVICTGEMITAFRLNQNQHILIPLRCS